MKRYLIVSLIIFCACGGSNVSLDAGGGNGSGDDGLTPATVTLSTETFEDGESVQTSETSDDNADVVVNAPDLSAVTEVMVFLDCSAHTSAGDPTSDYVALACDLGTATITYSYYCTASTDEDGNEIFTISRDTDTDPVQTEELFPSILVTCEKEDGEPVLFEEEFIAS